VLRRMVARIASPRSTESSARSVAVIVTTGVDSDDVIYPMLNELHLHGRPAHVSSSTIDASLGSRDISQAEHAGLADARLAQYLYELEAANDHMLYVADREPTAWSRRAIQRADSVIVVASAHPDAAEQRLIRAFLEACTDTRVPRWIAIVDSPWVRQPTPSSSSPVRSYFDEVHHIRRGNQSDLARLMRLAIGAGYGLVLGGGGARGFAHLGVIKALNELGVPIDRVGGASMGSIFAALSALYQDPVELMKACSTQFQRLLDYTVPVVALLKAKRITANLHNVFGTLDAEDLWIPFYCVSTNLTRSRLEVHRRGSLVTAIRSSIAIPGVLPPVPFGEELLIDGGVLNNVPADVMRADPSIGTVIAVDVAASVGPGTKEDYGMYLSGWQALRRMGKRSTHQYPRVASLLIRTMITGSETKRVDLRRNGMVDLYLDLEMAGVGLLEFDKMEPVVEKGYRAARPRIEAWLAERSAPIPTL